MAAATGRWWVPNDQFQVRIASTAGEQDGYGTWASAVEAAGPLSTSLGRSLGILDHEGRLYLRELDVPAWRPYLPAEAYVMGRRFETGLRFSNDAIRGIVQGDLTLGRGDCLDQWVAIPTPRAARV